MNAIAQRRPSAIIHAIAPMEPTMPPSVAHAVAAHLEPVMGRGQFGKDDPGHYVAAPLITERQWQVAQQVADRFDTMLLPVSNEVLAAWLLPVNHASRNPQSPQDFAMRVAAIAEMVGDLPAAAFTAETRRKLATGFFPSHEDVRTAVEPTAEPWMRKRQALRSLRFTGQQRPEAKATDPTERERIAAGLAALAAELQAKAQVTERPKPQPRYLAGDQLAQARRAAGIPA